MKEKKKYKLTDTTKVIFGIAFYQIRATADFGNIKKGELGGFVEKEGNLSQDGNAWVYGNARVYGDAWVYGDARVYGGYWTFAPLQIIGTRHVLRVCDDKGTVKVRCIQMNIKDWLKTFGAIGNDNGYTKDQITEYGMYLDICNKWITQYSEQIQQKESEVKTNDTTTNS